MINILHKYLTIAFLVFTIFILGLNVEPAGAQDTAVGTAASRRPADEPLSRFLRFGRLSAAEGLSNDQIRGIVQDKHGLMDCYR